MKLEDQVCSLELAKRLKELGVKQESYFYHMRSGAIFDFAHANTAGMVASAFTASELGEMLPDDIEGHTSFNGETTEFDTSGMAFNTRKIRGTWLCEDIFEEHKEESDTEVDARAKMLIYLLENKLI